MTVQMPGALLLLMTHCAPEKGVRLDNHRQHYAFSPKLRDETTPIRLDTKNKTQNPRAIITRRKTSLTIILRTKFRHHHARRKIARLIMITFGGFRWISKLLGMVSFENKEKHFKIVISLGHCTGFKISLGTNSSKWNIPHRWIAQIKCITSWLRLIDRKIHSNLKFDVIRKTAIKKTATDFFRVYRYWTEILFTSLVAVHQRIPIN